MILRISSGKVEERNNPLPASFPDVGHDLMLRVFAPKLAPAPVRPFRRWRPGKSTSDPQPVLLRSFQFTNLQTGADQMHNAGLHQRARKHGLNGLRKAFQPIGADDERILHAPVFQIRQHRHPVLGALVPAYPETQHRLLRLPR